MCSDTADNVTFIGIPKALHTVDDVLGAADKLKLPNAIVLSELDDGTLILLTTDMDVARANWLLDRAKAAMMFPNRHDKPTGRTTAG